MPTPVYVISGFLGAGKTTLINNVLESAPCSARIMVLVNEFGSISIDKKIIKADPYNIVDLSGGCICCGLITELIASLRFALDQARADAILIESTGLAVPQEIARLALSPFFEGRVEGGGIVTVVDAGSVLTGGYPIIREQLKEANVVVLNKIDLIDPNTLVEIRDRIKAMIPLNCTVFESSFSRISYNDIFTRRYDMSHITYAETRPVRFDSAAGFATLCLVQHSPVDADALIRFYREHHHKIVRSKGFVMTEKGGKEVQLSESGIEIKEYPKPIERTELVLIVKEEDRACIENALKTNLCLKSYLATPTEKDREHRDG
jgi:G3E family GTPase